MFELRLQCPQSQVDTICDALMALDALSVSLEDADANTDQEQALFGEPDMPEPATGWLRSQVIALFASEALAQEASRLLSAQEFFYQCVLCSVTQLPEQDWVRLTQSQFEPVPITPDFWVVPSWHEPPEAAHWVLRLDPGLAFGTGTHPTTRMCLRFIAHNPPIGRRVLDYGCGSGILAIGAAMFGASSVDAVDIDPDAIMSAQANALANRVTLRAGLPELAHGLYALVVANILAAPLKVLAPLLCSHLASGGTLLLAGILERQAEEIKTAYEPHLALAVADCQEGWVLMQGSSL